MGNKLINRIRVFGEIVSGLWAVIGAVTQAFDISFLNNKWQIALAVIVFVALAAWRMYENHLRLKPRVAVKRVRTIVKPIYTKTRNSDPNLVSTTNTPTTYVFTPALQTARDLSSTDFDYWNEIMQNDYYFSLVDYINNPETRTEQTTARNVSSEISYFDEIGNLLVEKITGRWWDEPEKTYVPRGQSPKTLEAVNIIAGGKQSRTLVIAMKHKNEAIFFAYNMDSIEHNEWRKKEYLLGSGKKYVCVTLGGENLDDFERWFMIYSNDKNEMQVIEVERPAFSQSKTAT
jgi:hypothetical protein